MPLSSQVARLPYVPRYRSHQVWPSGRMAIRVPAPEPEPPIETHATSFRRGLVLGLSLASAAWAALFAFVQMGVGR